MTNLFDLTGKVALVTGASSGLGVQMAKALAGNGASVALVARRKERLDAVASEIEGLGVETYVRTCDVSDVEQIKQTVEDVERHFGRIDILCNNAGLGLSAPAEEMSDEDWLTMMDVNLNAPYFFARECARGMIERGYGKIINTGSIHSTVGMLEWPVGAYATTKGGLLMMTKQLAVEWAKHGITVNAIGPAYFPSEMTGAILDGGGFDQVAAIRCPMGRPGREGELDGAVLYFASDASSYTTGQLLTIDGGWTAI